MQETIESLCKLLTEQKDLQQFQLVYAQAGGHSFEFSHDFTLDKGVDSSNVKFPIGCLIKILISGVLVYFDRSKDYPFRLSDSITEYLPLGSIKTEQQKMVFESLSIDQLLNHSSGIDDFFGILLSPQAPAGMTEQQIITKISDGDFIFPPGSRQSYCNLGYLLLIGVIERITKKNWLTFLNEFYGTNLQIIEWGNEITPDKPVDESGSKYSLYSPPHSNGLHSNEQLTQKLSAVVGHNVYLSKNDMKLILDFLVNSMEDTGTTDRLHTMAEHSFCSGSNRMFSGHGWYRAGSNIYVQSTNSTKTKGIIVVNREKKYALSFFAKGAGAYCGSVIVPHLVKSEGGDYYVFHSQTEAPKTSPYPFYLGKFRGNGHEFFIEYAEPLGLYARHRKYNMPEASAPVALLAFNEFMLVVKTNVAGWPADSRQIMYVQEGDKPSSYIKVGNILLTRY